MIFSDLADVSCGLDKDYGCLPANLVVKSHLTHGLHNKGNHLWLIWSYLVKPDPTFPPELETFNSIFVVEVCQKLGSDLIVLLSPSADDF